MASSYRLKRSLIRIHSNQRKVFSVFKILKNMINHPIIYILIS